MLSPLSPCARLPLVPTRRARLCPSSSPHCPCSLAFICFLAILSPCFALALQGQHLSAAFSSPPVNLRSVIPILPGQSSPFSPCASRTAPLWQPSRRPLLIRPRPNSAPDAIASCSCSLAMDYIRLRRLYPHLRAQPPTCLDPIWSVVAREAEFEEVRLTDYPLVLAQWRGVRVMCQCRQCRLPCIPGRIWSHARVVCPWARKAGWPTIFSDVALTRLSVWIVSCIYCANTPNIHCGASESITVRWRAKVRERVKQVGDEIGKWHVRRGHVDEHADGITEPRSRPCPVNPRPMTLSPLDLRPKGLAARAR